MMKTNNKTFGIFLILAVSSLVSLYAQQRTNVLMIVIDDLADYPITPKFNNVKTPNLDDFAASALSFSKAYCAGPICNPSRSAVISGISPFKTGVTVNHKRWDKTPMLKNCVGFPELFKKNGYTTMWWGKLWHGTSTPNAKSLNEWWDDYKKHGSFGPVNSTYVKDLEGISKKKMSSRWGMMDLPDEKWQDTRVANSAVDRLGKNYDKPFFMVTGFVRPHAPFTAPKRFFEMYDRDDIQLPAWEKDDWDDIPNIADELILHQFYDFDKFKATGLWKDYIQSYLASISFVDWNLGRVLDALDKSKYADNTIVVLWSDHGFHMGEKSHFCKNALWEQTTRTPFMIRMPKMKQAGKQCNEVVSLLDIYPTLVDICKLKGVPANQLDGNSLTPLLLNNAKWEKEVALMSYENGNHAIRNDRYRYICYKDGSEELYDHEKDTNEFINLALNPKYKKIKDEMAKILKHKLNKE